VARARVKQNLPEDFEKDIAAANERSDTPEAQAVQEGVASLASLFPAGKAASVVRAVQRTAGPAVRNAANTIREAVSSRAIGIPGRRSRTDGIIVGTDRVGRALRNAEVEGAGKAGGAAAALEGLKEIAPSMEEAKTVEDLERGRIKPQVEKIMGPEASQGLKKGGRVASKPKGVGVALRGFGKAMRGGK